MKLRLIAPVAAVCVVLALAGTARADDLMVPSLGVNVGQHIDNVSGAASEVSTTAKLLTGVARSGADAFVLVDDTWVNPCSLQLCASTTSQHTLALGEVTTELGRFRAFTYVTVGQSTGSSRVDLGLNDVVTFKHGYQINDPLLRLHIDATSRADSLLSSDRGYSLLEINVLVDPHNGCDNPDGCATQVFKFNLRDYEGSSLDHWTYEGYDMGLVLAEGTHLPTGGIDVELAIRDDRGQPLLPFHEYDLRMSISAYSECAGSDKNFAVCSTVMDAGHTVYMGLTQVESSTYAYRETPAVPEPATWLSMLLGLGLIGRRQMRQVRAVALQ